MRGHMHQDQVCNSMEKKRNREIYTNPSNSVVDEFKFSSKMTQRSGPIFDV